MTITTPSAVTTMAPSTTDDEVLAPPTRADGSLFRYEMLYAGMTRRAYADDPVDLLSVLSPGYRERSDHGRWLVRLHLAIDAQVKVQAALNTDEGLRRVTDAQRVVLSGHRHEPPVVSTWDCPVPLVLVTTDYAPAGQCPPPRPSGGMRPNVIWLDPSDEHALLLTLHDVGVVALHEAQE